MPATAARLGLSNQTGSALDLEFGDVRAKPERERDSLGHALQLPLRFQPPAAGSERDNWLFQDRSTNHGGHAGPHARRPCNPLQIVSAVSRKTHGAAGDFDVELPLSGSPGVECRDGGGAYTFAITFTNTMMSGDAAVTGGTGTVQGTPVIAGNTMTVELAGVTNVQTLTVTLSNLSDTFGQTLPDTSLNAIMLIGDTTGNQVVNASDVSQIKAAVGATVDGSNFRADLNINGIISSTDVAEVNRI